MSVPGGDLGLRFKVLLPAWICILALVSGFWALIELHVQDSLRDTAARDISTHASYLVGRLPAEPTDGELAELHATLREVVTRTDTIAVAVYLAVRDLDVLMRVAAQTMSDGALVHFPWSIERPEQSLSFHTVDTEPGSSMVVTALILRDGEVAGAVRTVTALGHAGRLIMLHRWMAAIAVLVLAVSFVFADRVARMLSRPLDRITSRVRELIRGQYDGDQFLGEKGPLRMVGRRLNLLARQMRDREESHADERRKLRRTLVDRTKMLHQAYEDMASLDRAKESFLSNLSHEMLTPLTGIMAAEDILRTWGADSPETRDEFLAMIHQESTRLLHLINARLDLAKLEARSLELDLEEVDLGELADEVATAVFREGREGSIALCIVRPSKPVLCACDRERVARVIRNIVQGAFRCSPESGSVRLQIVRGESTVTLSVEDEAPDSDARFGEVPGGAGAGSHGQSQLGFALAQKLAKAHGGSLLHRGTEAGGTMVELRLPLRRVPAVVG